MPNRSIRHTVSYRTTSDRDADKTAELVTRSLRPTASAAGAGGGFTFSCNTLWVDQARIWTGHTETGYCVDLPALPQKYLQLYFIEAGGYRARLGPDQIDVLAGHAVLFIHDQPISAEAEPGTRFAALSLPLALASEILRLSAAKVTARVAELSMPLSLDHPEPRLVLDMLHTVCQPPLQAAPSGAYALLDGILRSLFEIWPHRSEQSQPSRNIAPRHVRRAIDWIDKHIAEPMPIEAVAAAAGVSIRGLQTGFRGHLGVTPLAYITEARLRKARTDLQTGSRRSTIRDIAKGCGFSSVKTFGEHYRQIYGETPSQTRAAAAAA